jgi:HK97 family phage prohead protease
MLRKTQAFELKSIDESGVFEGIASVYGNIDSYGDIVEPGAFSKSIQERGKQIPVLWQHGEPIGIGEVYDAGSHLGIKGRILETVTQGADAIKLAKAGIVKGLSIGYRTVKNQWDAERKANKLLEVKLYEVSLVTFPANELASLTAIKSESLEDEAIQTVTEITREIKAGRMLSAANRAKLQSALDTLLALLAASEDDDDDKEAAKSKASEPLSHSAEILAALREIRNSAQI